MWHEDEWIVEKKNCNDLIRFVSSNAKMNATKFKMSQRENENLKKSLRRLERVFCCCSGCETMEDYKEGYLMVWANYMSSSNSIAGLYFEGTCDVISVTMATHKVHKNGH